MWRDGETPDLRSERCFPMWECRNMASPSKAAYSERKCPKSTVILTVNCPVYPPIQGKENRLPHRPIESSKVTGGLDFLIAYALMILCHSLFKVVIHYVAERGKPVIALITIHIIGNGNQTDIMLGKERFGELADLYVVSAQPGEVFDKYSGDISGLDCGQHFLKTGMLHGGACNTIILEKDCVGVALFFGNLLEYLFLMLDAVGLGVHIIATAQPTVEGGGAKLVIIRQFLNCLLPRESDNQYFQVYCTSAHPRC